MAKKKPPSTRKSDALGSDDGLDFEASLADVEKIVAQLESGDLGLSESLQQYETGIKQLKRCHALLDAAEQKVSLLSGFDSDGNPITQPLDVSSPRTGSGRTSKHSNGTSNGPRGRDPGFDGVDDQAGLF